jgi:hypothetical protein
MASLMILRDHMDTTGKVFSGARLAVNLRERFPRFRPEFGSASNFLENSSAMVSEESTHNQDLIDG